MLVRIFFLNIELFLAKEVDWVVVYSETCEVLCHSTKYIILILQIMSVELEVVEYKFVKSGDR